MKFMHFLFTIFPRYRLTEADDDDDDDEVKLACLLTYNLS